MRLNSISRDHRQGDRVPTIALHGATSHESGNIHTVGAEAGETQEKTESNLRDSAMQKRATDGCLASLRDDACARPDTSAPASSLPHRGSDLRRVYTWHRYSHLVNWVRLEPERSCLGADTAVLVTMSFMPVEGAGASFTRTLEDFVSSLGAACGG